MMKLTIIREDNIVYKDGKSYDNLDLSDVPTNVHALQWKKNAGWIEYLQDEDGIRPHNEMIDILPEWANNAIISWNEANTIVFSRNTANTL